MHPFKGFWEIKREKAGSVRTAMVLLLLAVISSVASGLYTGYLFNDNDVLSYNILKTIATVLGLFFFWCIANWCLTCLSDGEGKFSDICRYMGYSLLPYILIQVLMILLSNLFVYREQAIYHALETVAVLWTAFLIVIGTLVTHQYSLGKTLVICAATILGMCVMAYIVLLFFNLIQQMAGFVVTLTDEIALRFS